MTTAPLPTNGATLQLVFPSSSLPLFQCDETKQSAYSLPEDPERIFSTSDDDCFITTSTQTDRALFALGGFQIVCTAAQKIQIYLTREKEPEEYLTTVRTIRYQEHSVKAVCVIPGGPRPVQRARLQFLFPSDTDCRQWTLISLRVTARIMPPILSVTTPTTIMNPITTNTSTHANNNKTHTEQESLPSLSQEDLGAAMSAVSFMTRTAEERLSSRVEQAFHSLTQQIEQVNQQLKTLNQTVNQQHLLLQQQQQELCLLRKQQQQQQQEMVLQHSNPVRETVTDDDTRDVQSL